MEKNLAPQKLPTIYRNGHFSSLLLGHSSIATRNENALQVFSTKKCPNNKATKKPNRNQS